MVEPSELRGNSGKEVTAGRGLRFQNKVFSKSQNGSELWAGEEISSSKSLGYPCCNSHPVSLSHKFPWLTWRGQYQQ